MASSTLAPSGRPALAAQGVHKTFQIPEERSHTLKERAMHPFRRARTERFDALKGVSFAVEPGEFFGIVGRNGSGKSTLLKCLAGIYRIDAGRMWCNGRMSTFIELGVGFNPDLPAYENVVLNGIMLGLTPREARARYDSVIEFAELEDFQDLKLKNYSSGMHVRLAFSVSIQVDADILLIDEVLAVGDAAFQQKCFDVFNRLRDEGRTIVLVTHDMQTVSRFCHRAMLLERGEVVGIGDPNDIADHYFEANFGRPTVSVDDETGGVRVGDGNAQVTDVWLGDYAADRLAVAAQGLPFTVNALVVFREDVSDPAVALQLFGEDDRPIVAASSALLHERSGEFGPDRAAVFSFSMHNMLAPGRYRPVLTVSYRGDGLQVMDRWEQGFSFVVTGATRSGGMVELPIESAITEIDEATLALLSRPPEPSARRPA